MMAASLLLSFRKYGTDIYSGNKEL